MMGGEFIDITAADGFRLRAYRALPPGGRGPGLIVQQELFGLNRQIRAVCDQFAEEGYVVVAPDLFARVERDVELGYGEADLAKAFEIYRQIRAVCDQFAEEGYVVVAPDLFARVERDVELGYGEADLAKAFEIYRRFDEAQAV